MREVRSVAGDVEKELRVGGGDGGEGAAHGGVECCVSVEMDDRECLPAGME